jgi:hypothetical protein
MHHVILSTGHRDWWRKREAKYNKYTTIICVNEGAIYMRGVRCHEILNEKIMAAVGGRVWEVVQ